MELFCKSEKYLSVVGKIRKFLLSSEWMLLLFITAAVFTTVSTLRPDSGAQIIGTLVFAMIIGVCMVISDDILAGLPPFMFAALIAIRCYDSFDIFMGYKWYALPLVICLLFHFIVYHGDWHFQGYLLKPSICVSVAILTGGIGFITLKEYLAPTSLYHMAGLGFGMLFLYELFYAHIKQRDYDIKDFIAKVMVASGCLASFMVFSFYIININEFAETGEFLFMQWRNNCSTLLMIIIPFTFYMANRKAYASVLGFIFFFAILLTGSRGGMVFGAIEIVMCIFMYFLYDKRRRLAYIIICGCIALGLLVFSGKFITFLGSTVDRLLTAINGFLLGDKNEIRTIHFARGINDYLNNPIFGTGLGYMGNRDVFASKDFALCWYHCAPIQVAASFGTVGVIAFTYQFIKRNVLLWRRTSLFNITVFLSYISLEMMSLVNPGVFCPLPYVLLITMFFVIVEKSNEQEEALEQKTLSE